MIGTRLASGGIADGAAFDRGHDAIGVATTAGD